MKIVVATNNKGKMEEIKSILDNYEIVTLEEAGINQMQKKQEKVFLKMQK